MFRHGREMRFRNNTFDYTVAVPWDEEARARCFFRHQSARPDSLFAIAMHAAGCILDVPARVGLC
jgi:hypothetical protein